VICSIHLMNSLPNKNEQRVVLIYELMKSSVKQYHIVQLYLTEHLALIVNVPNLNIKDVTLIPCYEHK
jgi:hypothetical protein